MTNSNCSLNLWHFQRLTGTRISSVLARVREESVDAWHNFRRLVADEFPQEMLFVLFSLGVIVQYSSSSVLLGHSDFRVDGDMAEKTQPADPYGDPCGSEQWINLGPQPAIRSH